MSTDTKAIIGTIIATAVALAGLVITQINGVETEIQNVRTELTDRIDRLDTELNDRIDRLRDEMLENYHRLDGRMRTIEQGFARIDQRLDTVERAIIPSAEPAQ